MKERAPFNLSRRNIDVPLLIFLILFIDVKIIVKIVALIFIIVSDKNIKLGLSWKKSRLPLFYALILAVEVFKYIAITRNYTLNYLLVFGMGMLQWSMSLLAMHHLKLAVERNTPEKTDNTIRVFYFLNFLVSLFFLALLVFHPAWLSFWGQGKGLTFNSTSAGDSILGISFDASTVNAAINCLGLIYFLYKKDWLFALLCLLVVVLCTSNITFLIVLGALLVMVLTVRSNRLRLRSFLAIVLLFTLYLTISSSNREYIRTYFAQLYILNKNPDLNDSLKAAKLKRDSLYYLDKHRFGSAVEHLFSFNDVQENIGNPGDSNSYPLFTPDDYNSKPGKLISFVQTYIYLKRPPAHMVFGAGVGNFSSKLAFRASGAGALGSYPARYAYMSPEFRYLHFRTFRYYYSNPDPSKHSVLNFPYSVYNQILGEYGVVGVLLFAICYFGYFAARYKRMSYGIYMFVALFGFFFTEYWFELFSLVIIFELFLFLNLKEGRT